MRRIIALVAGVKDLLGMILIVRAADAGQLPKFITNLYNFRYGDKVGHFVLMGTLAMLVTMILSKNWRLRGLIILSVLITLEEFSQLFFTTRTFSLFDLACSLTGVCVFGYAGIVVNNFLDKKAEQRKYANKQLTAL